MAQATQTDTTPTTAAARGLSFSDRMVEMSTGINLLIDRLNHALDLGSNLGADYGEDGAYVVEAINETRWIAQRLSEEVHTVACEFDQDDSQPSIVKFKQAAE